MSTQLTGTKPLLRRPLDILLIAFYAISATYGLLFSLPEALGVPVSADSPWPPLRMLYDWSIAEEPTQLLQPLPVFLRSATIMDGFIHSPFLLVLIYALVKGKNWIRPWAILFAGSSVTNMHYYFMHTLLSDTPPPNTAYYLLFNLPWMLMPMLLAWRLWKPNPFGQAGGPENAAVQPLHPPFAKQPA